MKGFSVPNEELGHLIGEIILGFQDDDFEHQHDIEGRSPALGLCFAQDGKDRTKRFPIDFGGETFQETIELVKFVRVRFGRNKVGLHRQ
jgi:hypothetical protein